VTPLLGVVVLLVPVRAQAQGAATQAHTDLDAFMSRVLERRDENWKKLHDYILSETERFEINGPGKVPLYGLRREFSWYVREGFLIRSPVRVDGVAIPEPERRRYEERWMTEEKAREAKRSTQKAEGKAGEPERAPEAQAPTETVPSIEAFVAQRGEPRFISEAYFLRFKFEPGHYYLAGREQLDGREVVKVEYYPTRLFQDDEHEPAKGDKPAKPGKQAAKEREQEARIERDMNKVALVTLWIEPSEHQIVRYTFDNVDFGFLPGRWLVRVDDVSASMTMAKVMDGVWLPGLITMRAGVSFASGSYRFQYAREFYDHKKAEVSARIRSIGGRER
jgi:hypothetical protein